MPLQLTLAWVHLHLEFLQQCTVGTPYAWSFPFEGGFGSCFCICRFNQTWMEILPWDRQMWRANSIYRRIFCCPMVRAPESQIVRGPTACIQSPSFTLPGRQRCGRVFSLQHHSNRDLTRENLCRDGKPNDKCIKLTEMYRKSSLNIMVWFLETDFKQNQG